MRQHKILAEGGTIPGEDQSFDVGPLDGGDAGRVLKDHERAAPAVARPRGGRMGTPPAVDHGPHRVGKGR